MRFIVVALFAAGCLSVSVRTPFQAPPVLQRSYEGFRTAQCFGGVPFAVRRSGIDWWRRATTR